MTVEELNFNAIESLRENYKVFVGNTFRCRVKDNETAEIKVFEGEVRGAYLDENMDYRIVVLVKHINWKDVSPTLQMVNVKDVMEWSVPFI